MKTSTPYFTSLSLGQRVALTEDGETFEFDVVAVRQGFSRRKDAGQAALVQLSAPGWETFWIAARRVVELQAA